MILVKIIHINIKVNKYSSKFRILFYLQIYFVKNSSINLTNNNKYVILYMKIKFKRKGNYLKEFILLSNNNQDVLFRNQDLQAIIDFIKTNDNLDIDYFGYDKDLVFIREVINDSNLYKTRILDLTQGGILI